MIFVAYATNFTKGWWNVMPLCNRRRTERDESDLGPDYEDNYNLGNNWDQEELLINLEEKKKKIEQ